MSGSGVRRRYRGRLAATLLAIVAGAAATFSVLFSMLGAVMAVDAITATVDPTWNDGDGWLALGSFVAALVIFAVTAATATVISRAFELRRVPTVALTTAGALALALVASTIMFLPKS